MQKLIRGCLSKTKIYVQQNYLEQKLNVDDPLKEEKGRKEMI